MGAPDPENPSFLGFSVLRGVIETSLRPWSQKGPDHRVGVDPVKRGNSFKHFFHLFVAFAEMFTLLQSFQTFPQDVLRILRGCSSKRLHENKRE